ncbi:MAG: hypothetical protein NZ805_11935 [Armatimonadetes bacterium]|nr:hypothetical protein [Armatimonadota bacterium]MDW8029242.1 hypothetical protein [Armatimonadota bacterium]
MKFQVGAFKAIVYPNLLHYTTNVERASSKKPFWLSERTLTLLILKHMQSLWTDVFDELEAVDYEVSGH